MDTTICLQLCPDHSIERLQRCVDTVVQSGARSLLMLACDADQWSPGAVNGLLKALPFPVFGGIFPSIIHEGRRLDHGTLLVGLTEPVDLTMVNNLSTGEATLDAEVRRQCASVAKAPGLITLVDGLAKNIERFVESLYSLIGPGPDIVGCGAGSLDFIQKPCLFTNDGLVKDAGVVIGLPFTLYRGVQHGWEILDGPYLVTGSHGNVLETLNYQPAFDLYRERVEASSGLRFEEHDFFSIAKTYPFGIERLDGDLLVRDPIRVEQRGLVCVGEVPENAMVYVLEGQASRLVESAGTAASDARASYTTRESTGRPSALVFDCISRVLFLDTDFDRELDAIQRGLGAYRDAFGALTLGEITNTRNGPINLLNKSTVIGVF
ncbi:MAG: FIST C-terminal domain-containing protein [Nitrospirae bacterium]|nr:FIST C-terminal domain-containing protein [Nitrospirota bacterium]